MKFVGTLVKPKCMTNHLKRSCLDLKVVSYIGMTNHSKRNSLNLKMISYIGMTNHLKMIYLDLKVIFHTLLCSIGTWW